MLINATLDVSLGTLRFAEHISWTWQRLFRPEHLRTSMIIASTFFFLFGFNEMISDGLIVMLDSGLGSGVKSGLSSGVNMGIGVGLSAGVSYWLLLGLYQGIVQEHVEDQDRHLFNQGIRRSLHNGILISLVSASMLVEIDMLHNQLNTTMAYRLSHLLDYKQHNEWTLLISGFLLIWAMSGGLTILHHYLIRALLAHAHTFPFRAQPFLDDATSRILLRRIGGSYAFFHRRLQDYFADLPSQGHAPVSSVKQITKAPAGHEQQPPP